MNRSIEISEQTNHIVGSMVGYLTLAKILLCRRDWAGMDEAIGRFDRLAQHAGVLPIWVSSSGVYWKTRAWITQGRWGAIERLFQEFAVGENNRWVEPEEMYPEFDKELAFIHWAIARRELKQAAARLEQMRRVAVSTGSAWIEIEVSILLASVFHAQGDVEHAMLVLKHALSLPEPEGFFALL